MFISGLILRPKKLTKKKEKREMRWRQVEEKNKHSEKTTIWHSQNELLNTINLYIIVFNCCSQSACVFVWLS